MNFAVIVFFQHIRFGHYTADCLFDGDAVLNMLTCYAPICLNAIANEQPRSNWFEWLAGMIMDVDFDISNPWRAKKDFLSHNCKIAAF
jgi:membrane-associated PAP2 superfamily phosphatase